MIVLNAFLCCCYRYYDSFLPFLLEACNDEYPDVRHVHCPILVYYILMLLIQFWDVIEALSNKTIKFLCRLLFMVLVFVLSLVDLFSAPLLEVSCTIPFAYFVVMPYYIYFLDKCFCSIAEALLGWCFWFVLKVVFVIGSAVDRLCGRFRDGLCG